MGPGRNDRRDRARLGAHARRRRIVGGGAVQARPEPHAAAVPEGLLGARGVGAYAIVRHPIYSGLIIAAFGLGLWRHGWLTLVWALVLFAFFDVKSRLEERWLTEKFAEYPAYRTRVKKLIPWVY